MLGEATADAPVTHWSMTTLSTGCIQPTNNGSILNRKGPRTFFTRTTFSIKFRDFSLLGSLATKLSTMPHVSISNIAWRLTDITQNALASQNRKQAVEDAVRKANDYVDAIGGREKVDCVEIEAGQGGISYRANLGGDAAHSQALMMRMSASASTAGVQHLSFEPENVHLDAGVTVRFVAE